MSATNQNGIDLPMLPEFGEAFLPLGAQVAARASIELLDLVGLGPLVRAGAAHGDTVIGLLAGLPTAYRVFHDDPGELAAAHQAWKQETFGVRSQTASPDLLLVRAKTRPFRGGHPDDVWLKPDGGDLGLVARLSQTEANRDEPYWFLLKPFFRSTVSNPADLHWAVVTKAEEACDSLWLPDYGRTLAEDFARSRLTRVLAIMAEIPGDPDQAADINRLRLILYALHAPVDEESAGNLSRADFMAEVIQVLSGMAQRAGVSLPEEVQESCDEPTPEATTAQPDLWPERRLIKTARDAELYAQEVMRALGFTDAQATPLGADAGVDVHSSLAVAQVKMEGVATGRPQIQALYGVAALGDKEPLFFSLAGYTRQALEWAEHAGVACFEFAFDGAVEARTRSASRLMDHAPPCESL